MTNHWIDIKNSDCILIIGSNAAETHPISFKWVERARERGGKLIHVDPRFTRTSAKADMWAPIRAGTDIAFFGGLINYILRHKSYDEYYVKNYTNAGFIISEDFNFDDGLFSGFNKADRKYDKASWAYVKDENGVPVKDNSLEHKTCVFSLLKNHYARYDMKTVSGVTGTPLEDLHRIYSAFAFTGRPGKAGTMMYALGQTQHTVGVQNIRSMAIVQLLLGNVGIAGGGINALRGESNVQGATDHAILSHILPGYLKTPEAKWRTLPEYIQANTPVNADVKSANWWSNYDKYMASYLKAVFPSADPEYGYKWMPKLDDGSAMDYTWLPMFDRMAGGGFEGFFVWGQNPAVSGANAGKNRDAFKSLDWMVSVNIFDTETASFWRGPGADPSSIKTEVFLLPACVITEKEGSLTNSGRWMQWHNQAVKPKGESRPDGWIMTEIFSRVRDLYAKEGGSKPEPILALNWDFITAGEFDPTKVAKLINGTYVRDVQENGKQLKAGAQVASFGKLRADGSTACGNWLYSGSFTEEGNKSARRGKSQTKAQESIGLYPQWSWNWPLNRRILYNRASVTLEGAPRDSSRAVLNWDGKKWQGDVPDGGWGPGDKHPFIMKPEGHARLFGPGIGDGPFPEHYEPQESPLDKNPFSAETGNPMAMRFEGEELAQAMEKYPYICTTYRLTETWQSGVMSRNTGWLLECQPQSFCEISPELASEIGVSNGEKVIVESIRGCIKAVAMVTRRIRPLTIMGKTVHQVGLPWQFGWQYPAEHVDSPNILSPSVGDPNAGIPETKCFMVYVCKAPENHKEGVS